MHIGALFLFERLAKPLPSLKRGEKISLREIREKEEFLKSVFSSLEKDPFEKLKKPKKNVLETLKLDLPFDFAKAPPTIKEKSSLSPLFEQSAPSFKPKLPELFTSLPILELDIPAHVKNPPPKTVSHKPQKGSLILDMAKDFPSLETVYASSGGKKPPFKLPLITTPSTQEKVLLPQKFLAKYLPSLKNLKTEDYSSSFDIELSFSPKEDTGFLFALTLIPKADAKLPRFTQRFSFLIDRSNSVQQNRLNETKKALYRLLDHLSDEDFFNIIAFDSKPEKMSPNFLRCSEKSFVRAEEFLENLQLGSFFSSTDLVKPLLLTVPSRVEDDVVHTAILLSDGEVFAKKEALFRHTLQNWIGYNRGKVSLFTLGMNDPGSFYLDTLSFFSRGKLLVSYSPKGLKRRLQKLIKSIQNPIGKDISVNFIGSPSIISYPSAEQMPLIYLDQPFVIFGETDTLEDFVVFVQGKKRGGWFGIQKKICFANAKKGSKSLKEELASARARQGYEKTLWDDRLIAESEKWIDILKRTSKY